MLYQKEGAQFIAEGKTFTIGGEVFANGNSEYMGLFGTVTEIHTGEDRETESDTPDIHCAFQPPEDQERIYALERHFSELYHFPKKLDEIGLDYVIMAPDMLEPIPALLPKAQGKTYSLTCFWDDDDSCDADTLAVSTDIGVLLRRMWEDLETRERKVILSHVEQFTDGFRFDYEAKETDVEGPYLCYTITEIPVLPAVTETAA